MMSQKNNFLLLWPINIFQNWPNLMNIIYSWYILGNVCDLLNKLLYSICIKWISKSPADSRSINLIYCLVTLRPLAYFNLCTPAMMLMIMTINFCFQGVLSLGSLGRPSFGSRIQEREEETCICAPVVIGKSLS